MGEFTAVRPENCKVQCCRCTVANRQGESTPAVPYTIGTGSASQIFRTGFEGKTTNVLPAGSIATFIWKP